QLIHKHRISKVILVDPRAPLTLTSDKSGANYRDWWPQPAMVALVRRSIEQMQALHRAGAPFRMNRRGYLYVTADPAAATALASLAQTHSTAGVDPIRMHGAGTLATYVPSLEEEVSGPGGADILIDRGMVSRFFPHLAPEVSGVIHARNAGSVDPV